MTTSFRNILPDTTDLYLILVFFIFFVFLTDMGCYKPSIPREIHTCHYSVEEIDPGDDTGYYSYLRSFYFDGDFDFFNERKYAHYDNILPTGFTFNHWSIGPAIFWAPFFLLGHLAAICLSYSGLHVSLDGYSFPYYISTAIGSTLFSFGGIFLLSMLLCRFYEKKIAHVASFVVFASTSLIYFSFIRQRMAHALEFFLIVLFLFLWFKARDHEYRSQWMVLWGMSIGALAFTRYNDVTFLIIPALDFCHRFFSLRNKNITLFNILKPYIFFFLSFIITFAPMAIVWQTLNGIPFPSSWTNYPSHFFTFDFWDMITKFQQFFIGEHWGVFFNEPVWLIAIPGLWIFLKKEKFYGIILLIAAIFPVYISANPGGGAAELSFGHRFVLPVNPVLTIGLAAILSQNTSRRYFFNILLVLCILFVFHKYIQLAQSQLIQQTMPYPEHDQFNINSIKNIPFLFENSSFLIRSASLFKIPFYLNNFEAIDVVFLVLFPLSVLLGTVMIVGGYYMSQHYLSPKFALGVVSILLFGLYLAVLHAYKPKIPSEIISRFIEGAGIQLSKGKNPEKAAYYLKKALDMDNTNIALLNSLGEIHSDFMGNNEMGIFCFERSLSLSPNQKNSELIKLKLKKLKENQ